MQYFGEPEGWVKIQMICKNLQRYYTLKCLIRDLLSSVFVSPKFWLAKVFDLLCGQRNETSTNITQYLYLLRALFVLYEAELDNKNQNTINRELEFALFSWSVTYWGTFKSYEEENNVRSFNSFKKFQKRCSLINSILCHWKISCTCKPFGHS